MQWFEWYTMVYPMRAQFFLGIETRFMASMSFTKKAQAILVECSMVYQDRALHNYFTPCCRKYSGQQGQHNESDIHTMQYGKVECVTVKYNTVFLYPVWLYFLLRGTNRFSQTLCVKAELRYILLINRE